MKFEVFHGEIPNGSTTNIKSFDVWKKRIIGKVPSMCKGKHLKKHFRDLAKENKIEHYKLQLGFVDNDFLNNDFTFKMEEL